MGLYNILKNKNMKTQNHLCFFCGGKNEKEKIIKYNNIIGYANNQYNTDLCKIFNRK